MAKMPFLKIRFSRSGRTQSQHTTERFLHACVCCSIVHTSQAVGKGMSLCVHQQLTSQRLCGVYIHKGASLNHKDEVVLFS